MTRLIKHFESPLNVPVGTIVQYHLSKVEREVVAIAPAKKTLRELGFSQKDVEIDRWLDMEFPDYAWIRPRSQKISGAIDKHSLGFYNLIFVPQTKPFTDEEYGTIFI